MKGDELSSIYLLASPQVKTKLPETASGKSIRTTHNKRMYDKEESGEKQMKLDEEAQSAQRFVSFLSIDLMQQLSGARQVSLSYI